MPWAPALTEQQRRDTPQDSVERVTSAIRTIRPCSGTVDDHGRTAPNMFHLLDCGHVVVIDGSDTRCGSNCRYPINGANPQFSETLVKSPTAPRLISILATDFRPRQEPLYCEVCQGIPVDHYLFQKYRRRSLALTRGEIVAALQIPNDLVDNILAAPFPNPDLQEHNLHCGHKVYCVAQQPCGQNYRSHTERLIDLTAGLHQQQIFISISMGKQKTVTTGKPPGRPRGGAKGGSRGGGRPKGRAPKSATPAPSAPEAVPDRPGPKLLFKPSVGRSDSPAQERNATPGYSERDDQDDDLPQQSVEAAPVTTRTGRAIQKPNQYDAAQGSEIDAFIDQAEEDARDDGRGTIASDPSYTTHKAQEQMKQPPKTPKPRGRPPKNRTPFGAAARKSVEQYGMFASPAVPPPFIADKEIYLILSNLKSNAKINLDLPGLTDAANPYQALPYSAKTLTQLYVVCYQEKFWDLCDMVADTWIRKFHDQRKKAQEDKEKDEKPEDEKSEEIWLPNRALNRRKRVAQQAWRKGKNIPAEFDQFPRDYDLEVTDPELDKDVTSVHTDLLNLLYTYTSPRCGARLLWADALALGGDKTEHIIGKVTRKGFALHPELLFDIMQTSLRMVRRNLTLKVEESTEGAWCQRYHEHGKNGNVCYRQRASRVDEGLEMAIEQSRNREEVEGEGVADDVDLIEELELALWAQEQEDTPRAEKRGREDGAEVSPSKRARFVGEEEDAEGDSEED
ncbi:hypothetical protein J4E89_010403 [Alternaria sp. Ai002NY15]|nr:hypothetical protein J4E89_010403 [Alternaria sp. Ai002NY15]